MFVDLLRHFLRLGVAGRRPDLRHKKLEDIACCAQADELHAHVAVERLAVDFKAVLPPLGPLAHGQLGDPIIRIAAAANEQPVVAVVGRGVYQAVEMLRRPSSAWVHIRSPALERFDD